VKLQSKIRPVGDANAEPQTIQTTAPDFETGQRQLDELTPEGWQRLHIIMDREG
jgi:hypothetical protein